MDSGASACSAGRSCASTDGNFEQDAHAGRLYRWCDGVQYDQPFIPWLLFMRGGDRSYYIEGERTGDSRWTWQ